MIMKSIYKIIVAATITVSLSGCQDMMEYNEVTEYTKEQVFASFGRVANFVTDIYSKLDSGLDGYGRGAVLASACDEAEFAWSNSNIHQFYNGAWSPLNTLTNVWGDSYAGIRAANFYLATWEDVTFEDFQYNLDYNEQMDRFRRYQYEVRFLRAYFYFNLVKTYGDVPLVTELLSVEAINKLQRTSKTEIFRFINEECDGILNKLPVSYANQPFAETGRITKLMVLALKARASMYAASPLFITSPNGSALWEKAALDNKAVLDSCAKYNVKLSAYADNWGANNDKSSEMILARRLGDINTFEINNFPTGVEGGNGGNCPTQNLVDAYEMQKTGKLWNEDGSGYNPDAPYSGRDPRFQMTIVYNGVNKWPSYNTSLIETFEDGLNGYPLPGATPTGYYLKKLCDPTVNLKPNSVNKKRHSWVIFRLGEFYLNYAECVFRVTGSADVIPSGFIMSAVDAVNKIRTRSGVAMPVFPKGLSPEIFLKRYVNERMVELAFEEHRFWDIRRWKQGAFAEQIVLTKLSKDAVTGKVTYTRQIKKRPWNDKMYLFPIPDGEIRKNSNLTQNLGWIN